MKCKHIIILLVLVSQFFSCKLINSRIDLGSKNDSIYTNDQFDLSIEIPEGWYFIDNQLRKKIAQQNFKKILNSIDDKDEYLEVLKNDLYTIFTLFKFRPDTIIEVNPNIVITATNISNHNKLREIDYAIERAKESLKEVNNNFQFDNEFFEIEIDKKTFKGYESNITINNLSANYETYMKNYDSYNLTITISFSNESEKIELRNILKTKIL